MVEKFKVSTRFLNNLCAKYYIFFPIRGYWTKLKWNKPVEIIDFQYPEK